MWWDTSCDWGTFMGRYNLDRQGEKRRWCGRRTLALTWCDAGVGLLEVSRSRSKGRAARVT